MAKKKKTSYVALTKKDLNSNIFEDLSSTAFKLFFYMYEKYKGDINKEIVFTFAMTKHINGLKSTTTFYKALKELETTGLIIKKKQGGLYQQASRYIFNASMFIIF